jgi:SepF-like predicted cell division protein (DUF552 family)
MAKVVPFVWTDLVKEKKYKIKLPAVRNQQDLENIGKFFKTENVK